MIEIGENGKLPIGRLRKCLSRKKVVNHLVNLWGLFLYVSIEKRKGAKEHWWQDGQDRLIYPADHAGASPIFSILFFCPVQSGPTFYFNFLFSIIR